MKNKAFDHSKYNSWIDPKEVEPYERNAKLHTPEQVKNIVTSIRRFGWQQDTVITTDKVLVIGHGRRLAAIELGCEMPYHVIDKNADELTDDDIRELRIADNQTNAETGLDLSVLGLEVEDLDFEGFDFDFGFSEPAEDFEPGDEKKNSMRDKYLVPPFSVIYGNKPDWLARKRAWVNFGIRSEIGRGGTCLQFKEQSRGKLPTKRERERERETWRTGESVQEQQPIKQLYDRSQALATNTIARMKQMKRERKRAVNGNAV